LLVGAKGRNRDERLQLLETLKTAAAPINLQVLAAASDAEAVQHIVAIASTATPEWGGTKQVCAWRHPLIDRLEIAAALEPCQIPVITSAARQGSPDRAAREAFARGVRDSFIGITAADHCVAETATLVLRIRPGQPRSVSLVPSIHVAVITLGQILADFKELYAVLRWQDNDGQVDLTNCLTFISGPSKTADIEATLVHGAHGPRELCLIVLTG
jgi:L-lactate dehydrogenase complex protein LldG